MHLLPVKYMCSEQTCCAKIMKIKFNNHITEKFVSVLICSCAIFTAWKLKYDDSEIVLYFLSEGTSVRSAQQNLLNLNEGCCERPPHRWNIDQSGLQPH